jgi:hypothetical protein
MEKSPRNPNNSKIEFTDYSLLKQEYGKKYPEGLNFDPDGELHQRVLKLVLESSKASYDVISTRFPTWKEIDQKLTVFVDLDESEQAIKDADKSKPVSIVVPLSYATREILLTYWVTAFLNPPYFKYAPSEDSEDQLKAMLLEAIISQHCIKSKAALALHTMWSSVFTYGFGVAAPFWKTSKAFRNTYIDLNGQRIKSGREEIIKFKGNALQPIDPYNFLPNPYTPVQNIDEMEDAGMVERTNYYSLLLQEATDQTLFNVKFLEKIPARTSSYYSGDDVNSGRYSKTGISTDTQSSSNRPVDIITHYRWLIPSEVGLGNSQVPELYRFKVAADRVIISAGPTELNHNSIPFASMCPDTDGFTTLPVSVLEREFGLQHGIDWLWKSHTAAIRKSVNNMFVIDPSQVNMEDFVDSRFGLLARTMPSAWGKGVKDIVEQIPVTDITKNNIYDINFLMGIDSLVFTNDQSKGVIDRSGERVSAQEARDTRTSFLSKMEKAARIAAIQGHNSISEQMGFNTQQFMDSDEVVKTVGGLRELLNTTYGVDTDFLNVEPQAIDFRFDIMPNDGSIPGGMFADSWIQLLQVGASNQDLMENLDFTRAWLHIAGLLGEKHPDQFLKQQFTSRVETSEKIEKGVQAGNIVPAAQMEGVV